MATAAPRERSDRMYGTRWYNPRSATEQARRWLLSRGSDTYSSQLRELCPCRHSGGKRDCCLHSVRTMARHGETDKHLWPRLRKRDAHYEWSVRAAEGQLAGCYPKLSMMPRLAGFCNGFFS